MDSRIKIIEDLSLNAWPSHQIQIYDGWLLRFSYFYTHRTNCVEQIGASSIPLDTKIHFCEEMYRRWGTPAIFKISPLLPPSFDQILADRGYQIEHRIQNMILSLNRPPREDPNTDLPEPLKLRTSPVISEKWIDALFRLKKTTNIIHRHIVPSMYAAIPKDTVCVSIQDKKTIIATGLGILDRDYIGVYAIHVHEKYRRMHLGRTIVSTILAEAEKKGAQNAYLQVVADNQPALGLYSSLGFQSLYTDWFRVKPLVFSSANDKLSQEKRIENH